MTSHCLKNNRGNEKKYFSWFRLEHISFLFRMQQHWAGWKAFSWVHWPQKLCENEWRRQPPAKHRALPESAAKLLHQREQKWDGKHSLWCNWFRRLLRHRWACRNAIRIGPKNPAAMPIEDWGARWVKRRLGGTCVWCQAPSDYVWWLWSGGAVKTPQCCVAYFATSKCAIENDKPSKRWSTWCMYCLCLSFHLFFIERSHESAGVLV